jgi:iron(II)-dependent oxidoreductase
MDRRAARVQRDHQASSPPCQRAASKRRGKLARSMRAQRRAVCQLPLLAPASAGVTMTRDVDARCKPNATRARGPPGARPALAAALQASRADTLATFAAYERRCPACAVPLRPELNPPLWELGHIGWFQEFWLARNPQRQGCGRPDAPARPAARRRRCALQLQPRAARQPLAAAAARCRRHARRPGASSSTHAGPAATGRRHDDGAVLLPPGAAARGHAPRGRAVHGAGAGHRDRRPALAARRCPRPRGAGTSSPAPGGWAAPPGAGFAFDNELAAHDVALDATSIDAQVLRWAEYLPFVSRAATTTPAGGPTRPAPGAQQPTRRRATCAADGRGWQQWRHGRWQALDLAEPACHLTQHEAEAWCRWAGRRLPTEAEWERAALQRPERLPLGRRVGMDGQPLRALPGLRAHTLPRLLGALVRRPAGAARRLVHDAAAHAHPRYRNYFPADRNDVPAAFAAVPRWRGERGCARRSAISPRARNTANQPCASVQCCTRGQSRPRAAAPRKSAGATCRSSRCGCARRGEVALAAGPAHRGGRSWRACRCISMREWPVEQRHGAASRAPRSRPQQPVQVAQQVQVEGRGDAQRVVVGGFQHGRGLDQVDADQQRAAGGQCTRLAQQRSACIGVEVADAGAGVEHQRGPSTRPAGKASRCEKSSPTPAISSAGCSALQLAAPAQEVHRDVHRHVAARRQRPTGGRLGAVAGAQVDQHRRGAHMRQRTASAMAARAGEDGASVRVG